MEKHEGVPLVTKPLTDKEALSLMDAKDSTLKVRILISFDDLIECGNTNRFDDCNDGILPRVLESDYYLTDVSYNPVGIDLAINGGSNSIVLEVCGSLQNLVDEEAEEESEEAED